MLTEKECKAFTFNEIGGSNRYTDIYGLFLQVRPNGTKYWGLRISTRHITKTKKLGEYPYMSLKDARVKAMKLKEELISSNNSLKFSDIAYEWLEFKHYKISDDTYKVMLSRLESYVLPYIGHIPVKNINFTSVLQIIKTLEKAKKYETAKRILHLIKQILDYAVLINELNHNAIKDLTGFFTVSHKSNHLAAITQEEEIGKLLKAVEKIDSVITKNAILLQAYTLTRPNEVRYAEWKDINFKKRVWIIPAQKMKMKREHLVPLSNQAIEILQIMRRVTGYGKSQYVFPQVHNFTKPMTENTMNKELRLLTTKLQLPHHTSHGFRSTGSTLLHKYGFSSDVIEWALAHTPKNTVASCYNRHEYVEERTKMLQWYADFLDKLKNNKLKEKMQ